MLREILINVAQKEKRVALLENKTLQEFYIEREDSRGIFGNIYKGKVKTIIPGMGAAFVDLGLKKDGFLYVSDIVALPTEYGEISSVPLRQGPGGERGKKEEDINKLVKKGQEILVQVIKEPIGSKGVRLTTHISLPSRDLVLMPTDSHAGISRKIQDVNERNRLKKILEELKLPKGMGVIIRTVGQGKEKRELFRSIKYLLDLWQRIKRQSRISPAPSLVYRELDLALRIIRDSFTEKINKLIVDDQLEYKRIRQFIRSLQPQLLPNLVLHQAGKSLFETYNLEKEINKIFQPVAYLKSGGHIVIEETEGLVSIDVNTGRFIGKKRLEDTVVKTNCEAAAEVARQVRLRGIGGIIVIDFIDMASSRSQRMVLDILHKAFKNDRSKINILPFSEIGLVEITRQRTGPSLADVVYETCPYCRGRGMVRSISTISIDLLYQMRKELLRTKRKMITVVAHHLVVSRLLNEDRGVIVSLERRFRARITFKEDRDFHLEEYKIK